jgi:hypothetical protein
MEVCPYHDGSRHDPDNGDPAWGVGAANNRPFGRGSVALAPGKSSEPMPFPRTATTTSVSSLPRYEQARRDRTQLEARLPVGRRGRVPATSCRYTTRPPSRSKSGHSQPTRRDGATVSWDVMIGGVLHDITHLYLGVYTYHMCRHINGQMRPIPVRSGQEKGCPDRPTPEDGPP